MASYEWKLIVFADFLTHGKKSAKILFRNTRSLGQSGEDGEADLAGGGAGAGGYGVGGRGGGGGGVQVGAEASTP